MKHFHWVVQFGRTLDFKRHDHPNGQKEHKHISKTGTTDLVSYGRTYKSLKAKT